MFVLFMNEFYKHTIMNIKKSYRFLSIALILAGAISCSDSDKHTGFIDENEELLVGLSEVDGYDHTYNYDFNILKEREWHTCNVQLQGSQNFIMAINPQSPNCHVNTMQ